MKVKVEHGGDEYEANCEIFVDGESLLYAGDMSECPEDANLSRGLNFVYSIPDALKQAYEAGKRGEPFELEQN